MMLTCCIVDDETLARERLRALIAEASTPVTVLGEAANGTDAIALIEVTRPDIVFLDVQMPVLDGFDVAEMLRPPRPRVVFVTAYDQHALRAFDVRAADYLTKPVRLGRLNTALERIAEDLVAAAARVPDETAWLTRLTVGSGRRHRVVPVDEIHWIEARDKLVLVHLRDAALPTEFTLDELESRLDPARFLRLHRSHIVNASLVREVAPWFAGSYVVKLADGTQLPIARRRVRDVRAMLGGRV